MTDVTLSAATQSALLLTQRTTALAARISERIATGLRVTRAADDAAAFFVAQSLTRRAGDLLVLKDGINQSVSALGGALSGISAITAIANQLEGIAIAARGGSANDRASAAAQFDALRAQIDSLAGDAGFNGINLISASPGYLTVAFNETGTSSLTVPGVASDTASLGIGTAAGSFNNFSTDADLNEEAAKLLSLRLKTELSLIGQTIANENQQAVLKLY